MRLLSLFALSLFLSALFAAVGIAQTETATPLTASQSPLTTSNLPDSDLDLDAEIETLMAQMSPADRVGQLFMINFQGEDVEFDSDITELVYAYRVGGVVLSPAYGNFTNAKGVDTPTVVATLANQLQALSYGLLLPKEQAVRGMSDDPWPPAESIQMAQETGVPSLDIPLFVAVDQWGDDLPATSLRRGFTPLPSQMALGATWDAALAEQTGATVGRELRDVGVNMLLGPILDVLQEPRPNAVGSLGIHMFGGDPYWTSQLGRSYISGVHTGSEGRVATIARHFPGQGGTDRLPDQEVATIQAGVAEMERIALPPFRAVTGGPSSILDEDGDPAATDGLMSSHMRFAAFQGSSTGRGTPLGMTPELTLLLEQGGFATWRDGGGIMMSNALGAPAVRSHYDPDAKEFPYRQIALDAFSAGNDLLYLSHFAADGDWESEKQNIKATIGFFQDRYNSDPNFASQVDAALRRILRLKLRLYASADDEGASVQVGGHDAPLVPFELVAVDQDDLDHLSAENRQPALASTGQVARQSITVLYPDVSNLSDAIPPAPRAGDKLVIFTDSRLLHECDGCIAEAAIGPDELANIILRLYGPEATGQMEAEQIASLTFADLAEALEQGAPADAQANQPDPAESTPAATPVGPGSGAAGQDSAGLETADVALDKADRIDLLIEQSNWLIFAMLDVDIENYPNSDVVKRFLYQRGDQLEGKRVVVFGFHAPYFLDATDISKLTTYFGVYGRTQPFLESAIRALFHSFTPAGAPPVDVPGTRYASLSDRLAPDPTRSIGLVMLFGEEEIASTADRDESLPPPVVATGDAIRMEAGPVYDLNGKRVPDGTVVTFQASFEGEEVALNIEPGLTREGIAQRDLFLERGGVLHVAASAGDANTGEPLSLAVQDLTIDPATIADANPSSAGADVAAGMAAITTDTSDAGASTAEAIALQNNNGQRANLVTLTIALLTMIATLGLLLSVQVRIVPRRLLVYSMLWALIFGLVAYILYGLGLFPGAGYLHSSLKIWGAAVAVFVSMLFPLVWLQLRAD